MEIRDFNLGFKNYFDSRVIQIFHFSRRLLVSFRGDIYRTKGRDEGEGRKEINACTSLTRQNSSRFGRGTRKFPPASSDSRKGRQVMLAVVEECTERRPRWRAAPFTRISCNYYRVAALFLPARDQPADTRFASVIPSNSPRNPEECH